MSIKKSVLLISNTYINIDKNPALNSIYNYLKNDFCVSISGFEKPELVNKYSSIYKSHSQYWIWFNRLKINILLKIVCVLFSKDYHKILLSFKLFIQKKEFSFKYKKTDFIICIDVEAFYIAKDVMKRHSVKNLIYFYEFYADSLVQPSEEIYQYKLDIEKEAYSTSQVLLSTINPICGNYIKERYSSNIKIEDFTICPPSYGFSNMISNDTINFYYQGVYSEFRGLYELVLAFKNTHLSKLYLRGIGEYKNILENVVKDNNLTEKIIFLESLPLDELYKAPMNFDIGINMQKLETINQKYMCGFKTFEYISGGLAVIMPGSLPLNNLNTNYQIGWTYNEITIKSLSNLLLDIESNIDKINQCKVNSQNTYNNYYNPEFQKEKLISILKNA